MVNYRQDTIFMVSYTPVEYGKVKVGRLIIQTKEYYWNFMIKGTFPKYNPPEFKTSRIDNKLNPNLQKKLQHSRRTGSKNYVTENISKYH